MKAAAGEKSCLSWWSRRAARTDTVAPASKRVPGVQTLGALGWNADMRPSSEGRSQATFKMGTRWLERSPCQPGCDERVLGGCDATPPTT